MDEKDKIIQSLLTGAMIATMAATVRALIVKGESNVQRIRTLLAGVLLGTLVSYILRNIHMADYLKDILVACSAAFVSTLWPVIEKKFLRWVDKKKMHNVLPGGDD
jgi:ABC-type uncharacterized transport system permease subunit